MNFYERYIRKPLTYTLCVAITVTQFGCVTGSGGGTGDDIGPKSSSALGEADKLDIYSGRPKLEVIIPVFDPGLAKDAKKDEDDGIWPELRKAEANRFAYKLKVALEETGAFGAVRVTPDKNATGDLYVQGAIEESNGADVQFEMTVSDISGKHWFTRSFDHEVDKNYHGNVRNDDKDPYDPLFEDAANYLVKKLNSKDTVQLEEIQKISLLRFGAHFNDDAFAEHMQFKNGRYVLLSYPNENDPMLKRVQAILVRDQLFVDGLQDNYRGFHDSMQKSYLIWQEQSMEEHIARKKANRKTIAKGVGGFLLLVLATAALINSGDSDNSLAEEALEVTGGVVAGAAGASLIEGAFQSSKEAAIHRDALAELGQSIDMEVAPQVVSFENKTEELTGTAKEQFEQWRLFLKKIYEQEKTPEVQL
jgi:hypothetical protein